MAADPAWIATLDGVILDYESADDSYIAARAGDPCDLL
jgi:hypothetical protein